MPDDLQILDDITRRQERAYHGKYRGFVEDTDDPEKRGRVRVSVPSVLGGETSDWAVPCMPYGGGAGYGMLTVPPVGSQVLVEFIEGDLSSPVWVGTFWRDGSEAPDAVQGASSKVIATEAGHVMVFEDDEGDPHVALTSSAGARVALDKDGSVAITAEDGATVVLDARAGTLLVEDANGNSVEMTARGIETRDNSGSTIKMAGGKIDVEGTQVTIKGAIVDIGNSGSEMLVKGQSFLSLFNTHTHVCALPGTPTSPPMVPMTPAVLTLATRAG